MMDKYQEILLNKGNSFCVFAEDEDGVVYNAFINDNKTLRQVNEMLTDHKSDRYRKKIELEEPITLKQVEDINKKRYFLFLHNTNLKNVYYTKDNNKFSALSKRAEGLTAFGIKIDFDNKIDGILVEFKNDMAEPLNFSLEFVDADKEAYYDKIKQQENQDKLSKLNISHSCGNDLVTIKFQNCSENVEYTKITLFDNNKQLMGVFKVDEGMFYKSITNLAYGEYFYKVEQYDKENNEIYRSDYISVSLKAPKR